MISSTSRYSDSTLVNVNKRNGSSVVTITPSATTSYTFNYVQHVVIGVERVDNISYAYYGDPSKWWKIADANPEIMDFSNLESGIVLRIPNA